MLRSQFLCHVLKALFFIKIALKLSYFCKKMQNLRALGAPPPDPQNSPPLRISGYAPVLQTTYGPAVTRSSLERQVKGSNLRPVKLDTALPTVCYRSDISSKGAVLPGRNDAEMGPANSLPASAYYSEYNERFD